MPAEHQQKISPEQVRHVAKLSRLALTEPRAQKFDVYVKFLKNVQLLVPLADYERRKIAEALEEVSFAGGHTVFRQGDEGEREKRKREVACVLCSLL